MSLPEADLLVACTAVDGGSTLLSWQRRAIADNNGYVTILLWTFKLDHGCLNMPLIVSGGVRLTSGAVGSCILLQIRKSQYGLCIQVRRMCRPKPRQNSPYSLALHADNYGQQYG